MRNEHEHRLQTVLAKYLDGYDGKYQIYSDGTILSLKNNHLKMREIPYKMNQRLDKNGYLTVCISHKSYHKPIKVHRLVALSFIENPNNYPIVNHKNGIKTDNRVENLEWCTNDYNIAHAKQNGLIKSGGECYSAQKIIDTKTGKIYGSIKELWNTINFEFNYDRLRYLIKTNKTQYQYA
jgi:hypothetical protein